MASQDSASSQQKLFGQPQSVVQSRIQCTEEVTCVYCDRERSDKPPSKKVFGVDYQGFELAQCSYCGLRFLSKRPSEEQMEKEVYDLYWKEERDPSHIPTWEADIRVQIACIKKLRQKYDQHHPPRVLDVGCGNGFFLQKAVAQGWSIAGTELLQEQCEKLRQEHQCPIYCGSLPSIEDIEPESFDIIRIHHVLEHLRRPDLDISACYPLLKPEGLLYISVPNAGSFLYKMKDLQSSFHLKKAPYKHYAALHHNWFFNRNILMALCKSCGFNPIHWEGRVPCRPGKGGGFHNLYNKLFTSLGIGQVLDVYAIKPIS